MLHMRTSIKYIQQVLLSLSPFEAFWRTTVKGIQGYFNGLACTHWALFVFSACREGRVWAQAKGAGGSMYANHHQAVPERWWCSRWWHARRYARWHARRYARRIPRCRRCWRCSGCWSGLRTNHWGGRLIQCRLSLGRRLSNINQHWSMLKDQSNQIIYIITATTY